MSSAADETPVRVVPGAALSPALRRYLYLTAALTGAAVLIVEILGAKLLAPYLGTSHFVWTAQITVTLVSLATGYWLGGLWVDRYQDLRHLYGALLAVAAHLAAATLATERVAYACFRFPFPVASVVASFFLFFVPLTLLAAVSPFLIRVLSRSLAAVGGLAGRLSAVSTVGSVVGTVLIGYVLIPLVPSTVTMACLALALSLLALLYFALWSSWRALLLALLAAAVTCGLAYAGTKRASALGGVLYEELFRTSSSFGEIQVWRNRRTGFTALSTDLLVQNNFDPMRGESTDAYCYMLHELARAYHPRAERVLVIGLGIGVQPMHFAAAGATVDVVEINPALPEVARRYFGFDPRQVNVHIADGRQYLEATSNRYDVIVLDAFLGDSAPLQLMTLEAFALMRGHLRSGGILLINSFGDPEGGGFLVSSLVRSVNAAFGNVEARHIGFGNVFIAATKGAALPRLIPTELAAVHPVARKDVLRGLRATTALKAGEGIVLRDDYNPVDVRDAANQELARRRLAIALRKR